MNSEAILAKIQEEKKKSEDAQIEKSAKVINEFLEKHPDGQPEYPIEDLDEVLSYIKAVHYLEKVTKARKQAADTDALIEAIRGMGEEETEDIEDIDGSKDW